MQSQKNSSKNRVLVITPFYPPNIGGAETFAEDLVKVLRRHYHTDVVTIKWSKPMLWQGMNFMKAVRIGIKLFVKSRRLCNQNEYCHIYCLGLISSFVGRMLKMWGIFPVPIFSTTILALYDFKARNKVIARILNDNDMVFVEGHGGKEDMLRVGVSPDKIVKFNHWVDQQRFTFVKRDKESFNILFVGRPIRIKGRHIVEEVEEQCYFGKFTYVEDCEYDELPRFYQWADICIVPSLYPEGFSRVVVEAASCGCFLITSDNGSLPELVKGFGWAVVPDPSYMAHILKSLHRNKKFLKAKQVKTAEYARKHFSEKNAEVFL